MICRHFRVPLAAALFLLWGGCELFGNEEEGVRWVSVPHPEWIIDFDAHPTGIYAIVVKRFGIGAGEFQRLDPETGEWSEIPLPDGFLANHLAVGGDGMLVARGYDPAVDRSQERWSWDGGRSWQVPPEELGFPFRTRSGPAGTLLTSVLTGEASSEVRRSTDGGNTWTPAQAPRLDLGAPVGWAGDGSVYAATGRVDYAIARSGDGGGTWAYAKIPGGSHRVRAVATHRDVLYVGAGEHLYRSSDGGETFQDIIPDSEGEQVFGSLAVTRRGILYVVTIHGEDVVAAGFSTEFRLHQSMDGGRSWDAVNAGLAEIMPPDTVRLGFTPALFDRYVLSEGPGGHLYMLIEYRDPASSTRRTILLRTMEPVN